MPDFEIRVENIKFFPFMMMSLNSTSDPTLVCSRNHHKMYNLNESVLIIHVSRRDVVTDARERERE